MCTSCDDLLEVKYDIDKILSIINKKQFTQRPINVWKYIEMLPIKPKSIVSLNEGGTNLIKCNRLAENIGINDLYIKFEGSNPTGSFKDRGMTVGISKAIELGFKNVICASTGNTAASLAAYSSRAGLNCYIVMAKGQIALGKLAQSIVHGAKIIELKGKFDDAIKLVLDISKKSDDIYLLNSINPFRLEGQKTVAFEICDQLNGISPDMVVVPVGNAGNISAIWKGFSEYNTYDLVKGKPKMIGVQAEGASPIIDLLNTGLSEIRPFLKPDTIASAIRIGSPRSWKKAIKSISNSNGFGTSVNDQQILKAQKDLATMEGIFTEPAGASSIAALRKLINSGKIDKGDKVVCIATAHGLKDPDIIINKNMIPYQIDANLASLQSILGDSK